MSTLQDIRTWVSIIVFYIYPRPSPRNNYLKKNTLLEVNKVFHEYN